MYEQTLELLSTINLVVWLMAPAAAILADRFIKTPATKGWRIIAVGATFAIGRQLIKLLPAYDKASNPPEVFLPLHMWRYLIGEAGAILLLIGFSLLLVDYLKLKARMSAPAPSRVEEAKVV
jgi:hypothetical protein